MSSSIVSRNQSLNAPPVLMPYTNEITHNNMKQIRSIEVEWCIILEAKYLKDIEKFMEEEFKTYAATFHWSVKNMFQLDYLLLSWNPFNKSVFHLLHTHVRLHATQFRKHSVTLVSCVVLQLQECLYNPKLVIKSSLCKSQVM